MTDWRKTIALMAFAALLPLAVGQVEIRGGVEFRLSDANSSVTMGKTYTVEDGAVYGDALHIEDKNVSVTNPDSYTANTTLWRFITNVTRFEEAARIGVDAENESTLVFGFEGYPENRSFRIRRDGKRFRLSRTLEDDTVNWRSNEWEERHNFSMEMVERMKNVTLRLQYDLGDEDTFVDGVNRTEGAYTADDIDYAYVVSEVASSGLMMGLVNFAEFVQLGFTENGDVSANMTQNVTQLSRDSRFLVPFTGGGIDQIERREDRIKGGIGAANDILEFAEPNFAYQLTTEKTVRVTLRYAQDAIDLDGFINPISTDATIYIRNQGASQNRSNIGVKR